MPHIVHTERCEPERRLIRSDGALYVLLLIGTIGVIILSRVLAVKLGIDTLWMQIALYAVLLGTGYLIYRTRLVDYLYELYDTELKIIRAVGKKQTSLLTVPLKDVTKVGPYEPGDAKPTVCAYHGAKAKTTAIWFTENGERRVLCICASDALKTKLAEATHAEE